MSEGSGKGDGDGEANELALGAAAVVSLQAAPKKLTRKERKAAKRLAAELTEKINAQVLAAHPDIVAVGREAGWNDDKILEWIVKLAPIQVGDKELAKIGEQGLDAPIPVSATRRQLVIWRHQLSHWWSHGKGVQRLIYGGLWLLLLWNAVMKAGLGVYGYIAGFLVLGAKLKTVIGEIDPKHLPLFQRTLNERQLAMKNLLASTQHWRATKPSADEIKQFQTDALRMIASLVRDHRSDLRGKKIFVNLIVRSGDGVEVVVRGNDNRKVPMKYTRERCSIAWKAFETGVPQMTGDLYAEARKTEPGKSYNSVLALPVKLRDDVLAVVSIDSELKHHFHSHFDDLQTLLGPYVQLLASSMLEDHATPLMSSSTEGE